MTADDVLKALAKLLAPLIAAELSEANAPTFYATERGAWPRGARSRRHARDLIRRVPGHERIGIGATTEWRVSVAAYRAHHVTRSVPALPVAIVPSAKPLTAEQVAERTLSSMGLRSTKKSA